MCTCVCLREAQRDGVPIDWERDRETNQCIIQVRTSPQMLVRCSGVGNVCIWVGNVSCLERLCL